MKGKKQQRRRATQMMSLERSKRGESGRGGGVPTLVPRSVITVTQRQPLTSKRSRWRSLVCRGKCPLQARPHLGGVRGRLTLADVGVAQVPAGVLVVEGGTLLALPPDGVVLAVVADAAAYVARRQVHSQVKVARCGVLVALAPCKKEG